MTGYHLFAVALWSVAGNAIYQALNDQLWATAIERSWFQCTALLMAYGWYRLERWMSPKASA